MGDPGMAAGDPGGPPPGDMGDPGMAAMDDAFGAEGGTVAMDEALGGEGPMGPPQEGAPPMDDPMGAALDNAAAESDAADTAGPAADGPAPPMDDMPAPEVADVPKTEDDQGLAG